MSKYVDDEAESCDGDSHESVTESESDGAVSEREKPKFTLKRSAPVSAEKSAPAAWPKKAKMASSELTEDKPKLVSNKVLDETSIPPKPVMKPRKAASNKFTFRINLTNGAMFHKFLLPISNAVHELRFNLTSTPEFKGIRLEAHDTYLTLANKSRYECDVEAGVDDEGNYIDDEKITGMSFCVSAASFMQTLGCATLKDTVLTISKYTNSDKITFESNSNENDVQTVYSCDVLAESRLENLDGMRFKLGYHVNVHLKTLKEQTFNAKRCGASTIYFELYQTDDSADIVHSRMRVGFRGTVTSGSHDFYQSARRNERKEDGKVTTEWEPLPGLSLAERSEHTMEKRSYNEYDNSKLRLFLNHMDVEWVLVHLCNDSSQQPLVMECMVGGKNTKHTIIVAPKLDGAMVSDL
jgi:hypothetical protein